jgi:YVTN family beta-propeller protein
VTEIANGIVSEPSVVAITPDGGEVYVGSSTMPAISVISTESNSVVATVQNVTHGSFAMVIGPGDSDEDGVPDALEGSRDTDGDGVRDSRDTDVDGDTVPDRIEAGNDPANPSIPMPTARLTTRTPTRTATAFRIDSRQNRAVTMTAAR